MVGGGICRVRIPLGSPGLCSPRVVSNAWHAPSCLPAELPARSSLLRSRARPEPCPASLAPIPPTAPAPLTLAPSPSPSAPGAVVVTPHLAVHSLRIPNGNSPWGAASWVPTPAHSASPRHCVCPLPSPPPPQTPQKPGRDKVWGEALQKFLLSRRQVRGKRVLAEEPQPLRARAVGEGMLSQQQGPVIQVHGLARGPRPLPRAREHFSAPQASTPRFQRNAGWHWGFGKGSGWLFTSSSGAHACTHMHTHVLVPLHTPQTELLISLICSIAASQPALPCFAPCLRADLCPQVPLSPTSKMPLIPPQPFPDKPRAPR